MKILIPLTAAALLFAATASANPAVKKSVPLKTTIVPSEVRTVRGENGAWSLTLDGKPYFVRGAVFAPVKIGEDPSEATMRDWMYYDDNLSGRNDIAFETWVDADGDGQRGEKEPRAGDFELLRQMGANTLRLYHVASVDKELGDIYKKDPGTKLQFDHAPNKPLLRELTERYGIRVVIGNFLGAWTIGSGASWEEGTDYQNPVHRENIKRSVRAMVLDHKDEPYVLFWALGNENNIAVWARCNAREKPEAYASLIGELVDMIHVLDPNHPVAVIDGDGNDMLALYAKFAPNIDILGYNAYCSGPGLLTLYKHVAKTFDRPVYLAEAGRFAYRADAEDQDLQLEFVRNTWEAVSRAPNAIGITVFDWIDRWYMDGIPTWHNAGSRPMAGTPEGVTHEEWYGLMAMGRGPDSLQRRPRKAYDYLKSVWVQAPVKGTGEAN